jgi:hypothetical protein
LACSIISILFDAICLHFLLKFMDWNNSKQHVLYPLKNARAIFKPVYPETKPGMNM